MDRFLAQGANGQFSKPHSSRSSHSHHIHYVFALIQFASPMGLVIEIPWIFSEDRIEQ